MEPMRDKSPGVSAPKGRSASLRGRLGIRPLVAIVVLLPIVSVAAALVALSIGSSHQIAQDLGNAMVDDATGHIREQVREYLSASERMSDLYARRLESGQLSPTNLAAWNRFMLDDLVTHSRVASICFGNAAGDAVWLSRGESGLEAGSADGKTHAQVFHLVRDDGTSIRTIEGRPPTYDPREKDWYKQAIASEIPRWTAIYFWFPINERKDSETGTGYTRKIPAKDGSVAGVLVIDTTLHALSRFLRELPASREGYIYIVDEKGLLVAASHGPVTSDTGARLTMGAAGTPVGKAAAGLVSDVAAHHRPDRHETLEIDGQPAWATVTSIAHSGLHWRAVVVLPEQMFMAKARTVQSRALLFAGIAIALAMTLGYFLARQIVKPLIALAAHVRRIGQGHFEARLDLHAARELSDLSSAINTMAMDLRNRLHLQNSLAVATQVQQSLLPAASPISSRLDIYGASKYCDEAGGDYFDFIEMGDLPGQRALVAVGDVMGHGIGAALLMASARAALRATALRSGALGELLSAVNVVLARDNRHGRFMTMLLVLLEPEQQAIRWASAGHDPPILYEPRADDFIELIGGDVPLGVEENTPYEEYTFPCLNPHQVLLLGTDGIWEAKNAAGERFGKERLKAVLRAHLDDSARQIAQAIDAALAEFLDGAPTQDDVTFVVIKVLPLATPLSVRFRRTMEETE